MQKGQNNILAIIGPTAVGKTRLAEGVKFYIDSCFHRSDNSVGVSHARLPARQGKPLQVESISVDSKQVYIGMDIGTGKDAKIFGTDLVKPEKLFNVADYCRAVKPHIEKLWQLNKLPILVGGTGLYLKALIDGIETIDVPPNKELREELEKLSVNELQKKLLSMYGYIHDDTEKERGTVKMNNSDWNNPRRLIRRIEILIYCHSDESQNPEFSVGARSPHPMGNETPPLQINKMLIIGLTAPLTVIKNNIILRVKDRLDKGLLEEIKELIREYGWNEVLRNTIAYKEWEDFFAGKISKEEAITNWTKNEFDYAKRQLTWFKKDKRIKWLDAEDKNPLGQAINLISAEQLLEDKNLRKI